MSKNFASALIIALGLVASSFVLRFTPAAKAEISPGGRQKLFRATFPWGDSTPRVLGVVPAGTRLFLKDFVALGAPIGGGNDVYDVLVDGAPMYVLTIGPSGSNTNPVSLSVGLPVDAGRTVSLRRQSIYSSGAAMDILVAGTLE